MVCVGCIVKIGDDRPSQFCLREISNVLGRYASICQQVIIEIENIRRILLFLRMV